MDSITLILTVLGIHISVWLTPGPTFLLIVRNTLIYTSKSYIWNAFGIFLSNIIHTSYAIILLLSISQVSENITTGLKVLGGCYLIYLGYKTVLSQQKSKSLNSKKKEIQSLQIFREAFITNLLSPKASLFFLSIFSMVVSKMSLHGYSIFSGSDSL